MLVITNVSKFVIMDNTHSIRSAFLDALIHTTLIT